MNDEIAKHVEIFKTGEWDGREFTAADLQEIADNLLLGERQVIANRGGEEIGRVDQMYVEGNSLFADLKLRANAVAPVKARRFERIECTLKLDQLVLDRVTFIELDLDEIGGAVVPIPDRLQASRELDTKVQTYMRETGDFDYQKAMFCVLRDEPELAARYTARW